MALTGPAHRTPAHPHPHLAARKFGYLLAITANAAFFYLANVWPGWQVLPFLTADTPQVLNLLNFSFIAGIVVNTVYVLYDSPWCKAVGGFVLAAIALAVLDRIWRVYPFTHPSGWPALLIHAVLVVAMVSTVMAMIGELVSLKRHPSGHGKQR